MERKHPYNTLENVDSSWPLAEKSPTMDAFNHYSAPYSPQPLLSASTNSHDGRPDFITRNSNYSNYSQGEDEIDQFARSTVQQPTAARLSPGPQQRSTFHLPNRAPESPYRDNSRANTPE